MPGAGNPAAWNRYAYVMYNPVKFVDPSGHIPECGPDGMFCDPEFTFESLYNCVNCNATDEVLVRDAVKMVGAALGDLMGISPVAAFWFVYGSVTFERVESYTHNGKTYYGGAVTKNAHHIQFVHLMNEGYPPEPYPDLGPMRGTNHLLHELGHAFASTWFGKSAYESLKADMETNGLLRRDGPLNPGYSYGFASGYHYYFYQFADGNASHESEIFADMFVGWVTDEWFTGQYSTIYGVQMEEVDVATYMNMAEAKSDWINSFMNQLARR